MEKLQATAGAGSSRSALLIDRSSASPRSSWTMHATITTVYIIAAFMIIAGGSGNHDRPQQQGPGAAWFLYGSSPACSTSSRGRSRFAKPLHAAVDA